MGVMGALKTIPLAALSMVAIFLTLLTMTSLTIYSILGTCRRKILRLVVVASAILMNTDVMRVAAYAFLLVTNAPTWIATAQGRKF